MRRRISAFIGLSGSLVLLAVSSSAYSSWSATVPPQSQSISDASTIPAPTNAQITSSVSGEVISWTASSASGYGGAPLQRNFVIQGSSSKDGPWTTVDVVPGSDTSYIISSSKPYAYYSVYATNYNWSSNHSATLTNVSSMLTGGTEISTKDFSYTGSLQNVAVPADASYAVITAAAGNGDGGGLGDIIKASVPISGSSLTVLVGQNGVMLGGGGGLSGVFTGSPSQSSAIVIAGGGGGGGGGTANNSNGALDLGTPICGDWPGAAGSGGAGIAIQSLELKEEATPGYAFGAGGSFVTQGYMFPSGGYGGGGGGVNGGSGGGGGGYAGGDGGCAVGSPTASTQNYQGAGGQSYVVPSAKYVTDSPGVSHSSTYVDISFYGFIPASFTPPTLACTGKVVTVSVPSGAVSMTANVSGAGGGGGQNDPTHGGNGGLVNATIPLSSSETSLDILVGCGGETSSSGSGGGGGLSGIFNGPPSQSTALIIAGGGGGGANDYSQGSQSNGTSGGFTPALPSNGFSNPPDGNLGGPGYGGAGGQGDYSPGYNGTPFGAGGASSGSWSGPGGYGGGASGGSGWGGGGGGSGYVGGQGGDGGFLTDQPQGDDYGTGGQGGTSYVVPGGTVNSAITGGGGAGGYEANGSNGNITIVFDK